MISSIIRVSENRCDLLVDKSGRTVAKIDLSNTLLSSNLATGFLRAIAALHGHSTVKSQVATLYRLRYFVSFLEKSGLSSRESLPNDVMHEFHRWLCKTHLMNTTQRAIQNEVLAVLRWCHRNFSRIVALDMDFKVPEISLNKDSISHRKRLDEIFVKQVLAICYQKIEAIEIRILYGRALLERSDLSEEDQKISYIFKSLLRVGSGLVPQIDDINRPGIKLLGLVRNTGGLKRYRKLFAICLEDILPFYLVVLIQSAGNAASIISMDRDSIRQHPLRDDLEFLDWNKLKVRREQRVDFPKDKHWSAPNVLRKLIQLNENLCSLAESSEQSKAFLALGSISQVAAVPSRQTLHNALADFISESHLSDFDFADWRHTNAELHFKKTGNVKVSQQRLNHQSVKTTSRYISSKEFSETEYRALHWFQGSLEKKARGTSPDKELHKEISGKGRQETVFGFSCRDPFSGLDGITESGQRCLSFTKCCTCPGAVITLDDVHVIARILSAKTTLEKAKNSADIEGWGARFQALYADTLLTINNSILPFVPESVVVKARDLAMRYPTLELE
ncbi:hypothetical protein [Herbaspirillum lusitanum]|uniref:hypothetical protein n=1 Tax=Herbaspirillum lusitanum TaxID=213312 RepID=UPI00223886A4|nr:hypothetical protein [Herbaspirillum lusitanum]